MIRNSGSAKEYFEQYQIGNCTSNMTAIRNPQMQLFSNSYLSTATKFVSSHKIFPEATVCDLCVYVCLFIYETTTGKTNE
jgi:hypothetical protein